MAEFLTTKGIASALEDIITEAQEVLIIVSPYLQVSELFNRRLKDAAARGINIKILYGKDELKAKEREGLNSIANIELVYIANLHAKCYLNDRRAIVGSMNFFNYSETNNIEMALLIDIANDKKAFLKMMGEVNSLLAHFSKLPIQLEKKGLGQRISLVKPGSDFKYAGGYCIRCKTEVALAPDRPYCTNCFAVWVQFGNRNFAEKFCHVCGNNHGTDMERPLCNTCFRNWVRKHPYAIM